MALRLLDLRAGNQVVWSRRFDREAKDLLTLQDEVAAEVVAQIDPEILLIEAQRLAARPPADATAYDLVLRALPLLTRLERAQFMQAGELLRQAIALEPDYAAAHAWYAFWHMFLFGQAWAADPQAVMAEAGRLADRAITLDPQDARGADDRRACARLSAPAAARGAGAARAGADAEPEPGDGLGAVGGGLRLSGRARRGRAAHAALQEAVAARPARVLLRHRF